MSTNNLYQGIATVYNMCQDVGDVLSILGGGAEISNGLGEVVAGVVGTPETAGLSLTISGKGVLDVTHGSVMAFSGGKNFLSQKGRVKENSDYPKISGRNEKHSNSKAREAAKGKMEDAQERLKTMRNSGNVSSKEIEKVQKEIKHWKKKMDDAGETHHRK